jgi:uncharacterized protein YutE (UPF0331/DUF86 family)
MMLFSRDKIYEEQMLSRHKKLLLFLNDFNKKKEIWTVIESYAIERILQLFLDALVALSRYIVQVCYQESIGRSRNPIKFLRSRSEIPQADFETLMNVIGFRHVLVHDYLEVDRKQVRSIVIKKEYQIVDDWFMKWHDALQQG